MSKRKHQDVQHPLDASGVLEAAKFGEWEDFYACLQNPSVPLTFADFNQLPPGRSFGVLHQIAYNHHLPALTRLIGLYPGIDLKMLTKDGQTAWGIAEENGAKSDFMEYLRERLEIQTHHELVNKARDRYWSKFFEQLGTEVLPIETINSVPSGRIWGILHQVCYWGNGSVFDRLLTAFPDLDLEVETREETPQLPIDIAIRRGNTVLVDTLRGKLEGKKIAIPEAVQPASPNWSTNVPAKDGLTKMRAAEEVVVQMGERRKLEIDPSTTGLLVSQYSLYAEILSYVMYNTRDLAQLRLISKEWNQNVIPFTLKSAGFIKNCYYNTEYIDGLLCMEEDQHIGYRCNIDSACDVFTESGTIKSILFTSDLFRIEEKKVKYIDREEEKVDDNFESLLSNILSAKSFYDFNLHADKSIADGMYLSMEDLKQKESKYDSENSDKLITGLVTVEMPRSNVAIVQSGKIYPQVNLHGNSNDPDFFHLSHRNGTYKGYVVEENKDTIICVIPICMELQEDFFYDNDDGEDLFLNALWSKCQERSLVPEGIAFADALVPNKLHQKLMDQIDEFAEKRDADYHPHSNGIVRDLVHPALYSYVKGQSALKKLKEMPPATFSSSSNDKKESRDEELSSAPKSIAPDDDDDDESTPSRSTDTDYWGRAYEGSTKYQWLPTYFDVETDGTCNIADYINNLIPRSEFEPLYQSLSQLFSQALPLIESVFSYGRSVRPRIRRDGEEEHDYNDDCIEPIEEVYHSLRGKRLQVITKIVDYELGPGQSYEGVWHVEGMSHEEIVATCIYFIHRDDDIKGGDLLFKRAFHKEEATYISSSVPQCRPPAQNDAIETGLLPLGKVETLSRRLLVFPNSHVHKVTKMKNRSIIEEESKSTNAINDIRKRRLIVFFLINPEKRIVSTREVPPQQEEAGGNMSRKDAMTHRLELMKERKYTKQDWNVREIELCEH